MKTAPKPGLSALAGIGLCLTRTLTCLGQSGDPSGTPTPPEETRGTPGKPPILARLISEYVAPSRLGEGGAEASYYQVGAQTLIPFPIAGRLTGNLGLGIEDRGYDFSDFGQFMPGLSSPIDQALAARIGPGLSYRMNESWRLFAGGSWLYTGAPGASVQNADMWGGNVGAFYQVNSNLTLAFGVTVTERIGFSALVVPLLGMNWKPNDRWTIVAGDVANAINGPTLGLQASYRLNDRWTVFGLGGFVSTFTRFDEDSSIPDGSLRYRSAAALVGAEFGINNHLTVRLATGARLAQQYTFLDAHADQVANDTTGTSPTVGLTLRANF